MVFMRRKKTLVQQINEDQLTKLFHLYIAVGTWVEHNRESFNEMAKEDSPGGQITKYLLGVLNEADVIFNRKTLEVPK